MNDWIHSQAAMSFVAGTGIGLFFAVLCLWLLRRTYLILEPGTEALFTSFGKVFAHLRIPGPHFIPRRLLPWVRLHRVSVQRDFREYSAININDAQGTTLQLDLWVEFQLEHPRQVLFGVENWEKSLEGLVIHQTTSLFGRMSFSSFLGDRNLVCAQLLQNTEVEASTLGIRIHRIFIQDLRLLPEFSQSLFAKVSARIEIAKATIEETGRLAVLQLEAETEASVATHLAVARAATFDALGDEYEHLARTPEILLAYAELFELAQLRGTKLAVIDGFAGDVDAAVAVELLADQEEPPPSRYPVRPEMGGRPTATL